MSGRYCELWCGITHNLLHWEDTEEDMLETLMYGSEVNLYDFDILVYDDDTYDYERCHWINAVAFVMGNEESPPD